MDMYKFNESVGVTVFGVLLISGVGIVGVSTFVFVDALVVLRKEFIAALSKRFWGSSEHAIDHGTTSTTCSNSNNRRRLNLFQIINHIYWYHILAETGHDFVWAIVPREYYPDLEAYGKTRPIRTPLIFRHLLNYPSETAADFAEAFTRRVLSNLGFHHLSSNNCNLSYQDDYDFRIDFFEGAVSKSCFTRELIKRYNSIDLSNIPPPQIQFTDLEEMVLRRFAYYKPEDDEWVEPLNNWFNWYIKTIHERIFPSQDYQVFEATVKFLLFYFLHDYATPFTTLLALFGITDV